MIISYLYLMHFNKNQHILLFQKITINFINVFIIQS